MTDCSITHLFWDFDGTLYDTYSQMTDALLRALAESGLKPELKEAYARLKQSVFHACSFYAPHTGLSVQELMQRFRFYHAQVGDFPMYPGTRECLTTLSALGCHHYLYTHRDASALLQLRRDGLDMLFSDFVTRESGYPDKPAPDALLAMLEKHAIAPRSAVMVGDRAIDMDAGHNACIRGLFFDPDDFFPDVSAEFRVRSMRELCGLVSSTFGGAR